MRRAFRTWKRARKSKWSRRKSAPRIAARRISAWTTLAREAHSRRITHALVHTDRPYLEAIEAYLGFRGRNTLSER